MTHKKKGHKSKINSKLADEEPQQKRLKVLEEKEEDDNDSEISSNSEELAKLKITLSEEQYKELRKQLRERKRQLENIPILRLREFGQRALLEIPSEQRTPIFLTDIQH